MVQYHSNPSDAPSQPDSLNDEDGSRQVYLVDYFSGDDDDDSFSDSERRVEMPLCASRLGNKESPECSTVTPEQGPSALEHISQGRSPKSYSPMADDFGLRSNSKYSNHGRYCLTNSMECAKSNDNYPLNKDDHHIQRRSLSSCDHMESCSSRLFAPQLEYGDPSSSRHWTPVLDTQRFNNKLSGVSKQNMATPSHWRGAAGISLTSQQRCDMFNASKNASTSTMGLRPVMLGADTILPHPTHHKSSSATSRQSSTYELEPTELKVGFTPETSARTEDSLEGSLVCFLSKSDIATIMSRQDCDASGQEGHDTGFNISLYDDPKALFCCLSEAFTKLEKMMYRVCV